MKRITLILIAAVSLLTFSQLAAVGTSAVTPSYEVGSYYKNSKFYDRLLAVELTGDQRYDVVSIAVSQLGYHEGDSDSDMDGLNHTGSRNFVEYNHIWGSPLDNGEGNGVSYGFQWCAAFTSWCLRQAQVSTEVMTTSVSCDKFIKWTKSNSTYKAAAGYIPITGDLIYFRASQSLLATHVGIVVGTDSNYVYTIEGNNGGRVDYHRYSLTDSEIVGYSVPAYTVKSGTSYADFPLTNGYVEPGVYLITASQLNVRSGPSTDYPILTTIIGGTRVTLSDSVSEGNWARVTYNGVSGWMSYISNAQLVDDISFTVRFHANGGTNAPPDLRLSAGESYTLTSEVPTLAANRFVGWALSPSSKTPDYLPGQAYTADGDLDLYAIWEYRGYEVTFLNDDGSVISRQYFDKGAQTVIPPDPQKPGSESGEYVFSGWDLTVDTYVSRDRTYTATYTAANPSQTTDGDALVMAPADGGCQGGSDTSAGINAAASLICLVSAALALAIIKKFM